MDIYLKYRINQREMDKMKFNKKFLVEVVVGVACVTLVYGTLGGFKEEEPKDTQVVTLQSIGSNQNGIYQVGDFITYKVNPLKTMGEVNINVVEGERVQLAQDIRQLVIAEVPAEQYILTIQKDGKYYATKLLTQDQMIDTIDLSAKEVEEYILEKENR